MNCLENYGFVSDERDETEKCFCSIDRNKEISEDLDVCDKWTQIDYIHCHLSELETVMLRGGVPQCQRGRMWMALLDYDALVASSTFNYESSVDKLREQLDKLGVSEYDAKGAQKTLSTPIDAPLVGDHRSDSVSRLTLRQIFCDVERTYTDHKLFNPCFEPLSSRENVAALFRVLAVHAMYNPSLGYCQGMSYIVGTLLMHLSELESFWCLVALIERNKFLRGFYEVPLSKIQQYSGVFGELLKSRLPKLHRHLKTLGVSPILYVTPWFMGVFTHLRCWEAVMSVWDLFMLHGITALFRVAMATLELCQADLLTSSDLCFVMPNLLKPPIKVCGRETLMTTVGEVRVEPWEVESLMEILAEEVKPRKRRRTPEPDLSTATKKCKTQGSLFRRFTNMFTPKKSNLTHSTHMIRRNHSSCTLIGQHLLKKYIQHSARAKLTFKDFNTARPLRPSQKRNLLNAQSTRLKSDVELRPIKSRDSPIRPINSPDSSDMSQCVNK